MSYAYRPLCLSGISVQLLGEKPSHLTMSKGMLSFCIFYIFYLFIFSMRTFHDALENIKNVVRPEKSGLSLNIFKSSINKEKKKIKTREGGLIGVF